MKNRINRLMPILFFFACTIISGEIFSANSGLAQVKLHDGTVISAWQGEDTSTTFATIEGVIGSISSDPTTWTRTTLTASTDYALSAPTLITNDNGDAIVIYEFFDTITSSSLTAAAMLPEGTTTWIVNTISNGDTFANLGDQTGSIDESGNVIATWSAYNTSTNESQVMCSTSSISTTPTWSGPTKISP